MKTFRTLALLAVALTAATAVATPITYSFSDIPSGKAASATFSASGSNLIVTLTNTSTQDAMVPTDVLTAVYFQVTGDPLLTRTSAMLAGGSNVFEIGTGTNQTAATLGGNVGGEWCYLNTLGPPNNRGVSAVGLGMFGPGNVFDPLQDLTPPNPDGIGFGIVGPSDNVTTGNGGITGRWLIKNSVTFTLGGFSGDPSLLITSAKFQYGTSLDEPQFIGTPEPASVILFGLGGVALVVCHRRRKHRCQAAA